MTDRRRQKDRQKPGHYLAQVQNIFLQILILPVIASWVKWDQVRTSRVVHCITIMVVGLGKLKGLHHKCQMLVRTIWEADHSWEENLKLKEYL